MIDLEKILSSDPPMASRIRCPELLTLHKPGNAAHFVQFYEDDAAVIKNVSYLAAKALGAGDSCVIVATIEHRRRIDDCLEKTGLELDQLRQSGRYVALDAARTLSQFSTDGVPDEARFNNVVGGVIRDAAGSSANGFVFAFGEMVALLCAEHRVAEALRLEQYWNSLSRRHLFSLFCAYPLSSFGSEPDLDAVIRICTEHSLTLPAEILS